MNKSLFWLIILISTTFLQHLPAAQWYQSTSQTRAITAKSDTPPAKTFLNYYSVPYIASHSGVIPKYFNFYKNNSSTAAENFIPSLIAIIQSSQLDRTIPPQKAAHILINLEQLVRAHTKNDMKILYQELENATKQKISAAITLILAAKALLLPTEFIPLLTDPTTKKLSHQLAQKPINSDQLQKQITNIIDLIGGNFQTKITHTPKYQRSKVKMPTTNYFYSSSCPARLSCDGSKIIVKTYLKNETAQILDSSSGETLNKFKNPAACIKSVGFSHTGKKILIMYLTPRLAKIWDTETTLPLCTVPTKHKLAHFSYDDTKLIVLQKKNIPTIWNLETGELIKSLDGHKKAITSARFSHDNTKILTASEDGSFKLWDPSNQKLIKTIKGHKKEISSARFSRDDKKFLTASLDGTVKVWLTKTRKLLKILQVLKKDDLDWERNPYDEFGLARFSHDDRKIITCAYNANAQIWSTETGQLLQILQHNGIICTARFNNEDSQILASIANRKDIDTRIKNLEVHAKEQEDYCEDEYKETGTCLLWELLDKTTQLKKASYGLQMWNAADGQPVGFVRYGDCSFPAHFSHDTNTFVVTFSSNFGVPKDFGPDLGVIYNSFNQTRVTAAEYIIYQAFKKSGLQAVQLVEGSYGAQIINKLNSRFPADQPLIPVQ